MNRVLILGGNNSLGQIIARQLLNAGMSVTVFSEGESDNKISHHRYQYVKGDVYNILSVDNIIANHDAVISVYTSTYLWKLFYLRDALQNILRSMTEQKVSRFIFFHYSHNESYYTKGLMPSPFFKKIFVRNYDEKTRSIFFEDIKKCSLEYTINYLDWNFLKHLSNQETSESIKRYYFSIAEEVQRQLTQNNSHFKEVYHKSSESKIPA